MTDLVVNADDVAPVMVLKQQTGPTSAVVTAGKLCRMDSTGMWTPARGNNSGNAGTIRGISIQDAEPAGEAITVVQRGLVDLGAALDGLAIGAAVYLSDTDSGVLADAAGTVSVLVGYVVGNYAATTVQRLLDVQL